MTLDLDPKVISLPAQEIANLRRQFMNLREVTAFASDIKLAAKIATYGLSREIGTVNDELARFIFDAKTAQPVRLKSLRAEIVEWRGLTGLRVFSVDSSSLELRAKGFYDVIHPQLSANPDGTLHSLYIFPEIIAKIAEGEGIELVLVKSWGVNSIFGGFDPSQGYYQTNFWEIENNDALKFADLVRQGKVAFLGTHDLIAHIAGLDQKHWPLLKENAEKVYAAISVYFKSANKPSVASLILPYTIGVVLDDLAQPPSYSSKNHIAVLNELLQKIAKNEIPAGLPSLLTTFPQSFQKVVDLSRTTGAEDNPDAIQSLLDKFVKEVLTSSVVYT